MPQSDKRRRTLQQKAKELRTSLDERRYAGMDVFLGANGLTHGSYLDIVRSTLRRPTLLFRRKFDELMTNKINPYIAGEVNSNIDIQFILDEYSCAEYVVEYVNKSARGMGNLRHELTTMMQEHPERDYTDQLKALSIKLHTHSTSHIDFYKDFTSNSFGYSCIICDRLWWKRDLKMSTSKHESILKTILQYKKMQLRYQI